jgi:uncharacterized protein YjbI with pentapeptide repeats
MLSLGDGQVQPRGFTLKFPGSGLNRPGMARVGKNRHSDSSGRLIQGALINADPSAAAARSRAAPVFTAYRPVRVQAFSCVGRRVLFRGCKLDSVNFRDSRLTDVAFEDCVLRDVDFGSAKLIRVRFPGCQFANVDFTKATCTSVDLRGARLGSADTPGIKAGYDSLSGTRIDSVQLMTLAPLLADHLGIKVAD